MTSFKTADLCDSFSSLVQIAQPLLQDYGGLLSFYGKIVTVQAFDDNALVREKLSLALRFGLKKMIFWNLLKSITWLSDYESEGALNTKGLQR